MRVPEKESEGDELSALKSFQQSASIKPRRRPPIKPQKEREKKAENNDGAREQNGSAASLS